MLRKVDALIDSWVDSYSTSRRALSFYRIFFAAYAVLFGLKRFAWVADYPGGLWRPPFPFSLLDAYGTFSAGLYTAPMPEYVLIFLEGVLCLFFVLLLFGIRTPYVSASITVLLIVLNWQIYSLPKTNHDILFCVTPLIMSFSGWGHFFSVDGQQKGDYAYPSLSTALLALTITTGFAVAGVPKLMHWMDFDLSTSGVRMWVTGIYFPEGGGGPLSSLLAHTTIPLLWEAMDITAVCFEIGFLLAVFRRQCFRLWLSLAVVFHFANYLILGIPFFFNLPVYAAFLPWDRFGPIIRQSFLNVGLQFLLPKQDKKSQLTFFVFFLGAAELLYFIRPGIGLHRTGTMKVFQSSITFGIAFAVLGYLSYRAYLASDPPSASVSEIEKENTD